MKLQEKILRQYLLINDEPTLKDMAHDTGIQVTRVFRILNGSSMKLSEYEIIRKKVSEKLNLCGTLEDLAFESSTKLPLHLIKEIEIFISRKLALWHLKNSEQVVESKNELA
jgi:hypothetical protein